MAFTGVEKAFCVLEIAKCESIVMVQRGFRTQYHRDPHTDKRIRTWYNNFEQTGSLSAGKRAVRTAKCVGCGSRTCKRNIHSEPPSSPDLTPCEFSLWGYVKDHVFVPSMPLDLAELRQRIEHAVAGIDHHMLVRALHELDYRIDVCRVTNDGHMEKLKSMYRNFERYSILWHKYFLHVCHGCRSRDSWNLGGTFGLSCIQFSVLSIQ